MITFFIRYLMANSFLPKTDFPLHWIAYQGEIEYALPRDISDVFHLILENWDYFIYFELKHLIGWPLVWNFLFDNELKFIHRKDSAFSGFALLT